ncbi:MAG: hypothetical protein JSV34_03530 [Candidatus Omnitrophota bacterium]|nr:MAG: hypothetical protein JSV34_03530 [Candidatus Omnitrophota bacterium]
MNKEKLKNNHKAAVLILVYVVTVAILTMGVGYVFRVVTELSNAKRFLNREKSLWVAEAGATVAYYNLKTDSSWSPGSLSEEDKQIGSNGQFSIVVIPSGIRNNVTVTGTIAGAHQRSCSFSISYRPLFNNAISAGGKLLGTGLIFSMDINGNAQVGNGAEKWNFFGGYQPDTSWITTHEEYGYDWYADTDPKIIYPDGDSDGNADPDEFSDFKDYNQETINDAEYSSSEIVYVQTNSDVLIYPGWNGEGKVLVGGEQLCENGLCSGPSPGDPVSLTGKKILYVEGDNAGDGDVDIIFGASEVFNSGEDLTVISTGDVTYIEPLQSAQSDSRLNAITWQDYNEAGIFYTNHTLNVFAHDEVNFLSFLNISQTEGTYTSNNDTELIAILARKDIDFPSDSEVPPGFEGFLDISQGSIFLTGSVGTLNKDWQEL